MRKAMYFLSGVLAFAVSIALVSPQMSFAGTCQMICDAKGGAGHCWGDSTQDCSECIGSGGTTGDPCFSNADCACIYECDYSTYTCQRRCPESCYGDWDGPGVEGSYCNSNADCHCAFECVGSSDDDDDTAPDDDISDDDSGGGDDDSGGGCGCSMM